MLYVFGVVVVISSEHVAEFVNKGVGIQRICGIVVYVTVFVVSLKYELIRDPNVIVCTNTVILINTVFSLAVNVPVSVCPIA